MDQNQFCSCFYEREAINILEWKNAVRRLVQELNIAQFSLPKKCVTFLPLHTLTMVNPLFT